MGLGDDEGPSVGVGPSAEGVPDDRGVVAAARRLEVGEVDGVVDVPERVGVAVADLDGVAVAELAVELPPAYGSVHAPAMLARRRPRACRGARADGEARTVARPWRPTVREDDLRTSIERGRPSYSWRYGQDRRLEMVRRFVDLEGAAILDVGCGIGTYVRRFRRFSR